MLNVVIIGSGFHVYATILFATLNISKSAVFQHSGYIVTGWKLPPRGERDCIRDEI
jgi:hypothetical protein